MRMPGSRWSLPTVCGGEEAWSPFGFPRHLIVLADPIPSSLILSG